MDKESATLVLRTANCAVADIGNSQWTWRNVDLRKAIGTLYNHYDHFKLCLTSYGSGSAGIGSADDRTVNIYMNMSNCYWVNSGYDVSTNNRSQNCLITTADLNSGSGRSINYTGEIGVLFKKPDSGITDITIFYRKCSNDTVNAAQVYANSVYCFSIYGVTVDGKS